MMTLTPRRAGFGSSEIVGDGDKRSIFAAKYYRSKYGTEIPQNVLDTIDTSGLVSAASIKKIVDEHPPRAGDLAPAKINATPGIIDIPTLAPLPPASAAANPFAALTSNPYVLYGGLALLALLAVRKMRS